MKKEILSVKILVVLIISSLTSNAQWTAIANPYAGMIANDGAVSFSIGTKGYLLAGSSTGAYYEYDTLANGWTQLGNVPASMGHAFAMSFVVNNKAYIVGGDTAGMPLNSVWEFDPAASNPWSLKDTFPGGVRDAGFGFAIGNYGYIGAGFDGAGMYNDIWKYNPSLDSWSLLPATIPANGLIFPASFVIGNNGYILTGGTSPSGVNELKKMWCLDGTTGSITPKSNFPGSARQAAIAFSNNLYGFVAGGQSGYVTNYNDMWKYDEALGQWFPSDSVPMLGAAWSSAFTIGNTAYAGLGAKFVPNGLTGTDAFYKFSMDISTGINQINKKQISLYPNPAGNYIYFNSVNPFDHVKICDITGKVVLENNSAENNIFIGSLPAGVYTITLQNENDISINKFVKE